MARLQAVFLLGMTLGLLTGCGSSGGNGGGGTTPPPPSTGSLSITVSELPSGASASITVSGPSGYTASVTSTQTLQVAPGSYTVAASSVSAGNSNYYPAIASQSATVAVSTTASVTVDYATIIPTTTKAIDAAGKSSLTVSSDGSTITMSTSSAVAASLQAGDILASGITSAAPNGLLVKIMSVSTSGQTVTASVEPATLEQAIQQGTLQYSATLDTTNTTSSAYLPKASSRSRRLPGSRRVSRSLAQPDATGTGACANNPNTLNYPFPSVPIVETPNASWTLLGESDFCPTISFAAKISAFSIESASATATLGVHNAIGVEGMANGEFNPVYTFPAITSAPIEVPIGPIVVVVQASITSFLGLDGNASASAYAGITTDSTASVSLSYANGMWTPSGSASPTVVQPVTSVDGQVSVKAYAGLKAGVLIYGTVTPYLSVDDYLQFQAGLNMNPCWNLKAGVEGSVGISGTAFGKDFDYATTPLNLFPAIPIAQSTGTCFMPVLSAISPTTAAAGSAQITLAVTGSNFVPDSTVNWNGQALATTYVDTTDLTAVVPASDLTVPGTFPVTVNSPDSPGGTSTPMNFAVSQVTVAPANAAIPTGASQQFTAKVTGASSSGVNWSVNGVVGGSSTVGIITQQGLYTAPTAIPSPASVVVTASLGTSAEATGNASVQIITGSYIFTLFDVPGSWETEGFGINDSGLIVGTYYFTTPHTSETYGFIDNADSFTNLIDPMTQSNTKPFGVNSSGAVVGTWGNNRNGSWQGFLYVNGVFGTLEFPGAQQTFPNGINNLGDVVGCYDIYLELADCEPAVYASGSYFGTGFLWSGGSFISLSVPGASGTYALGINDGQQIVGNYNDPTTVSHGFIYSGGSYTTLDFPGARDTYAEGINNEGDIVGAYVDSADSTHGFVYRNGNYQTLDYPGGIGMYTIPFGLNSFGQIIGSIRDVDGGYHDVAFANSHGFVATPVSH